MVTGTLINFLPEGPPLQSSEIQSACGCPDTLDMDTQTATVKPVFQRLKDGLVYAFTDLLKDIGGWLMLGILIAGIISYFVPIDFVERYLGGEYSSLLIMLVIGIPLYICASASTPVAAALVLKGLSPGAALVFLLAGPATNAATMTVVSRQLGKAAVTVYVLAIAVSSLVIGWGVNRFYSWLSIDITGWMDQIGDSADSGVYLLSSIVLVALLVRNYLPRRKADQSDCGCHQ
jgi:hypothetical protein